MSFEELSNEKLGEFLNKQNWQFAEDRYSAWEQINLDELAKTHFLASHLIMMRKIWTFGQYGYQVSYNFLQRYSPDIKQKPKPEWKVGKAI